MFSVTVNGSSLGELQTNLKNLLSQFQIEDQKTDGSELGYSLPKEQPYVEESEDDADYGPATVPFVAPVPFTAEVNIAHAPPVVTAVTTQPFNNASHDSKGMPYDKRIHSATKATKTDGSWRYRRGVEDEEIQRVEAELRGYAKPQAAAPIPEVPQASVAYDGDRRLVTPSQPYIPPRQVAPPVAPPPVVTALPTGYDAPPAPLPVPDIKPAHTFDTFKSQMIQTIADLVEAKKIDSDYLQLLKNHFKVAEIWDIRKDDAKCLEMFNGFVDNGLITRVG